MDTDGDLADKAIVGIHVTEDPAAAVEMHYYRQHAFAVFRANDAHADCAFGADRKRRVLDTCIGTSISSSPSGTLPSELRNARPKPSLSSACPMTWSAAGSQPA